VTCKQPGCVHCYHYNTFIVTLSCSGVVALISFFGTFTTVRYLPFSPRKKTRLLLYLNCLSHLVSFLRVKGQLNVKGRKLYRTLHTYLLRLLLFAALESSVTILKSELGYCDMSKLLADLNCLSHLVRRQPRPISCGVSLHVVLSDDYTCITMPGHTYYKPSLEAAPAHTIQLA